MDRGSENGGSADAQASAGSGDPTVRLDRVSKHFGELVAVRQMELDIGAGEFFTMLGPSGCGKTTTLRMVAGFEQPTAGRVLIDGQDVAGLPSYRRPTNTVFQSYALFPHLDIFENVAFGLRRRGIKSVKKQVEDMLDLVQLGEQARKKPHQLSGGQQQRVAVARALINHPKVLLLDEPLGALDLKLRREMQVELKQIQREVGITFVFVTHDQEEALTMSDRIAVMRDGRIEQLGTPAEVYERPATPFVAGFVGTSNLLEGAAAETLVGEAGVFTVRPEKIHVAAVDAAVPAGHRSAVGSVNDVAYVGPVTRLTVELDAGPTLVVLQQNLSVTSSEVAALAGTRVRLLWQPAHTFRLSPAPVPAPAGG